MKRSLYAKTKPGELALKGCIYAAAALSVTLLSGIIGYVFFEGFGVLNWAFLTTVTSALKGTVGIAGNIVNTLYLITITLLLAIPIGVGAAIYLNEYARPGRLVALIEFATETLSGIPSVVFGLFGMVFFGTVLKLNYTILNGALTLTLMVLPLIVRNTQEALRMVPDSYRSGALGIGASQWYMIRTILLPSAMPGILTGVLLAVGRIVGESAALLFTAGSARLLPKLGSSFGGNVAKLFEKLLKPGGTLTVELYLQMNNGRYEIAFGIGCVLLILVFGMNVGLRLVTDKLSTP